MPVLFQLPGAWRAPRCADAANDNHPAPTAEGFQHRLLLRDALRHFAAHGADAAEQARSNAEAAFFAGKRPDYLHWLAICRALDRRMVDRHRLTGLHS